MITLSATARYGFGGKQYIARITGRDRKFTFAREFVGRREGKRNEDSVFETDEPGLYLCCDIDRRGDKEERFRLVLPWEDDVAVWKVAKEDALKIARALDDGRELADCVEVWGFNQEARDLRKLATELRDKVIPAGGYDWIGRIRNATGNLPPDATEEQAEAERARLEAELVSQAGAAEARMAELEAAGKYPDAGYRLIDRKEAERRKVVQGVESATETCWQVLQVLPEGLAKKVLTALRQRLSSTTA
jgi:hypothetical protein